MAHSIKSKPSTKGNADDQGDYNSSLVLHIGDLKIKL